MRRLQNSDVSMETFPVISVLFGWGQVFLFFFIIGLHLFIGKYFWLPFSVFLSYKVLKRKSYSNFYKLSMGEKMLFECSCFCHCCCDVTTILSRFCSRDTCLFWHASRFAHDEYLSAKLHGSNVAGDKCSFLPGEEGRLRQYCGIQSI